MSEPISDEARCREIHGTRYEIKNILGQEMCDECEDVWPCVVIRALNTLEAQRDTAYDDLSQDRDDSEQAYDAVMDTALENQRRADASEARCAEKDRELKVAWRACEIASQHTADVLTELDEKDREIERLTEWVGTLKSIGDKQGSACIEWKQRAEQLTRERDEANERLDFILPPLTTDRAEIMARLDDEVTRLAPYLNSETGKNSTPAPSRDRTLEIIHIARHMLRYANDAESGNVVLRESLHAAQQRIEQLEGALREIEANGDAHDAPIARSVLSPLPSEAE